MKKILLVMILLNIIFAYDIFSVERKPDVKGGFKECIIYFTQFNLEKSSKKLKQKKQFIKYDNKGFKIELLTFSQNRKIDTRETYKYDSNGNLIEEIRYDSDTSDVSDYKEIFNYDNYGNIIEVTDYITNKPFYKTEYIYTK